MTKQKHIPITKETKISEGLHVATNSEGREMLLRFKDGKWLRFGNELPQGEKIVSYRENQIIKNFQ